MEACLPRFRVLKLKRPKRGRKEEEDEGKRYSSSRRGKALNRGYGSVLDDLRCPSISKGCPKFISLTLATSRGLDIWTVTDNTPSKRFDLFLSFTPLYWILFQILTFLPSILTSSAE